MTAQDSQLEELPPCPFCGSNDVRISGSGGGAAAYFCWSCEADGPPADDATLAAAAWSRRIAAFQASPPNAESLETVRFWANAYTSNESDEYLQGRSIVAKLLNDYVSLLESLIPVAASDSKTK